MTTPTTATLAPTNRAIILSIGDELVLGQTIDTNSAWLSQELISLGIFTLYHHTVADDRIAIAEAIKLASTRTKLILISGGLGPTEDDLTRDALADAMGVKLIQDPASVAQIQAMYTKRGRVMPEKNKVQAMHPVGTTMIPNSCGTAPGIIAWLNSANIYIMPGVPSEMKVMFTTSIKPLVGSLAGSANTILTAKINTFGQGESQLAEALGPALMDRTRNPIVGTTVADGVVSVRIRSEYPDPKVARHQLDDTIAQVESKLGAFVYSRDAVRIQETVVNLLKDRALTLATAESCTGGMVAEAITSVSGSSTVFRGSFITYHNDLKIDLGVDPADIRNHGAVSQTVAKAMAISALKRSASSIAISTTGIAGPDGGTQDKPVGTVWVALAYHQDGAPKAEAWLLFLGGDRETIRDRTTKAALQLIRYHVLGLASDDFLWGKKRPDLA
jgi:nicotinamide-nucleotide amidase